MHLALRSLCVAIGFATCAQSGAGERPNVLLLLVDDLKPAIGAYGDPFARTPNLDRLAARGTRFDFAYCNQAVCAPSRNNLLVGSRSTTLGIYSLGTNFRRAVPDAITLPQYFMRHGYRTESMGKVFHIGHGNVNDDDPDARNNSAAPSAPSAPRGTASSNGENSVGDPTPRPLNSTTTPPTRTKPATSPQTSPK